MILSAMKISVITLLSAIGCVAADHGLRRGLESRSLEEFIEVNSAFPAAAFVTLDPRDPVVAVAFDLSGGFVEGYCGTTFGTDVSGTIKEKELKDGTARIVFNLKIKNAWSAVVEWSPQGMPLDFPNWLYGTNHFTQTCGDPEAASLATVNLYYRIHVDEPGLPLLSYLAQFQQGQVEFLDMVLRAVTPTGAKVRVHKKLLFDNPNCADDDKVPPPFYNYVNGDNIYAGLVCEPVAEVSIHE